MNVVPKKKEFLSVEGAVGSVGTVGIVVLLGRNSGKKWTEEEEQGRMDGHMSLLAGQRAKALQTD